MSVVTQIEEAGPSRLKVTIEVPAPAVEAELGRVVKDFRGQVNIPGFRKGKVPVSVIRRRFKKEVESEVAERLLPRYWRQAEAEKDLDPLLPPTVEELKMEEGEPMTVVAVVETRPEIVLGDIENFDLPEENTDATEPEIDEALADLRKSLADWEKVDRSAAQGDMVWGTAVRTVTSEPAVEEGDESESAEEGGPQERPIHVEIGAENVDEELSLALTGKRAGQSVLFETAEGPEEAREEVRYDIEVIEVKEQKLPELDDELASKLGDFDSLEKLREALTGNISARKAQDLRHRRRKALLEQLRQRHPLTPPEGVVQQETERMMREMLEHMASQGADLERANLNLAEIAEGLRPQAEMRVHDRLVLDAVAKEQTLRLDESRFEEVLTAIAQEQGTNSLAVRQRLAEDGRLETLRSQLRRDQTVAHLLGEDDDDEESAVAADGEEE
ncbi:MAG: trigger factor [Thermoanaerobaculia bacterium]|nr:trigger factor [Thermoanaerobaculia bacterium]